VFDNVLGVCGSFAKACTKAQRERDATQHNEGRKQPSSQRPPHHYWCLPLKAVPRRRSRLLARNWPLFCGRFLVPAPSRRRGSKDPRPAQRSVVPISQKLQVNQVIPGRENHQHQNESETNAEPDFLRALAERTPSDGLDAVEQKMTAIEHRYREQI